MQNDELTLAQEIGRELFGYKKEDVDKLLAILRRDLHVAIEDREKLQCELASTHDQLASYIETLESINTTAANAEEAASEIITQAQKEAEIIVSEAQAEAALIKETASANSSEPYGFNNSVPDGLNSAVEDNAADGIVESADDTLPQQKEEIDTLKDKANQMQSILDELATIHGVEAAWVFDDNGAVLSQANCSSFDLQDMTSTLASIKNWSKNLPADSGQDMHTMLASFAVIEFGKYLLILDAIDNFTSVGLVCDTEAPLGIVFGNIKRLINSLSQAL